MECARKEASGGRVPGSFRDPSGFVFIHKNEVFRALSSEFATLYRELLAPKVLPELFDAGLMVETSLVFDDALCDELSSLYPGYRDFVRHSKVSFINYPCEWSFSMLADAALHTLDLQTKLLTHGLALKDATPYNIQFVDGKPIFIDLTSIEKPHTMNVWYAMGQFYQMFLYPLLLSRFRGVDFRSYFLGEIGGRSLEQVVQQFSTLDLFRPSLILDLSLPYWLQRRHERKRDTVSKPLAVSTDPKAQLLNLNRLKNKIKKLRNSIKANSAWSEYTLICNYTEQAEEAKKQAVASFLEAKRQQTVLDVGC
ncbi:MAG: hypothetical protein KDD62_10870, partial [Bdellovibrionales bacterium]|nr:hypothetical protein [Bdellovibrionales bacterium]